MLSITRLTARLARPVLSRARPAIYNHRSIFPGPHTRTFTVTTVKMAPVPKTIKAARVHKQGGIDEIVVEDVPIPEAKPDEILIKVEWAGVNFIDTYFRGGVYPRPTPFTLGQEAAGSIVALPSSPEITGSEDYKIRGFKEGVKVAAYANSAFAEYVAVPWKDVQVIPEGLSTRQAAASLTQGLTALTFVEEAYTVKKGDHILVHAAAGGVGLLLVQLASQIGAIVIGTTSSQIKADIAKKAGAAHVINYTEESVPEAVLKLTNGKGVEGIFDGVGASTWDDNFTSIRRKGTIVSFGNASGVVPPFSILKLGPKNIKVCRPVVGNYTTEPAEFHHYSSELLKLIKDGKLDIAVHAEYPFTTEGVRQTHTDITGRGTSGKLVIKVSD